MMELKKVEYMGLSDAVFVNSGSGPDILRYVIRQAEIQEKLASVIEALDGTCEDGCYYGEDPEKTEAIQAWLQEIISDLGDLKTEGRKARHASY